MFDHVVGCVRCALQLVLFKADRRASLCLFNNKNILDEPSRASTLVAVLQVLEGDKFVAASLVLKALKKMDAMFQALDGHPEVHEGTANVASVMLEDFRSTPCSSLLPSRIHEQSSSTCFWNKTNCQFVMKVHGGACMGSFLTLKGVSSMVILVLSRL